MSIFIIAGDDPNDPDWVPSESEETESIDDDEETDGEDDNVIKISITKRKRTDPLRIVRRKRFKKSSGEEKEKEKEKKKEKFTTVNTVDELAKYHYLKVEKLRKLCIGDASEILPEIIGLMHSDENHRENHNIYLFKEDRITSNFKNEIMAKIYVGEHTEENGDDSMSDKNWVIIPFSVFKHKMYEKALRLLFLYEEEIMDNKKDLSSEKIKKNLITVAESVFNFEVDDEKVLLKLS